LSAKSLFIFGYGYVAAALARQLRADGWELRGTARDAEKRFSCAPLGIQLVDFADSEGVKAALATATHVLCCIPPAQMGGDVALKHYRDALKDAAKLEWVGYCSTTAVYGNTQGAEVDEATPTAPDTQRGHLRLDAERSWSKFARERNVSAAIFRIAGIYGPGQSAIDQLRKGTARRIDKPGHVFSRVHVDDIAGVMAASMEQQAEGIFNLADTAPCAAREVVEYAATLTGLALPPLEPVAEAEMSAMLREFYAASRRVRAGRLGELGYQLRYPSYREGLDAYASLLAKAQAS
jgi:nucleoside-diphosphate-sugar epimerase